jgi:hypothetical protein
MIVFESPQTLLLAIRVLFNLLLLVNVYKYIFGIDVAGSVRATEGADCLELGILTLLLLQVVNAAVADVVLATATRQNQSEVAQTYRTVVLVLFAIGGVYRVEIGEINIVHVKLRF